MQEPLELFLIRSSRSLTGEKAKKKIRSQVDIDEESEEHDIEIQTSSGQGWVKTEVFHRATVKLVPLGGEETTQIQQRVHKFPTTLQADDSMTMNEDFKENAPQLAGQSLQSNYQTQDINPEEFPNSVSNLRNCSGFVVHQNQERPGPAVLGLLQIAAPNPLEIAGKATKTKCTTPRALKLYRGMLVPTTAVTQINHPYQQKVRCFRYSFLSQNPAPIRLDKTFSADRFLAALVVSLTLADHDVKRRALTRLWKAYIQIFNSDCCPDEHTRLLSNKVRKFFNTTTLHHVNALLLGLGLGRKQKTVPINKGSAVAPRELQIWLNPLDPFEEFAKVNSLTTMTLDSRREIAFRYFDVMDMPGESTSRCLFWSMRTWTKIPWSLPHHETRYVFGDGPSTHRNRALRPIHFADFVLFFEMGEPEMEFIPKDFNPLNPAGPGPSYFVLSDVMHEFIRPMGTNRVLLPCQIEGRLVLHSVRGRICGRVQFHLQRTQLDIAIPPHCEVVLPKVTFESRQDVIVLIASSSGLEVLLVGLDNGLLTVFYRTKTSDFRFIANARYWASWGVKDGLKAYVAINSNVEERPNEVCSHAYALQITRIAPTLMVEETLDLYHSGSHEGLFLLQGIRGNVAVFRVAQDRYRWAKLRAGRLPPLATWNGYSLGGGLSLLNPQLYYTRSRLESMLVKRTQEGKIKLIIFEIVFYCR